MERLVQMRKELGYEGNALQEFVKQQQDDERAERHAEREFERDKIAGQIRIGKSKGIGSQRIGNLKKLKSRRKIRIGNLKKVGLRRKKLS